ncbi:Glutaconyl-CoA decarboxylase subunit gamma [Clostridium liquoris]|uniref:Glutaconyl-CoA decarboxylase subunit gamma n=1 Tax=Clostridium liquoris TaxID=1289519 RepID=A0A2T0AZJ4_9CLOT|nr:biotin/lipoyl-containing protein [Clostridium liquoris]PRR76642.1 Glutaconyl-CoA decarboxylase subunit gamma [Clostridium liquoris]
MKKFYVTVNGNRYEVEVEELAESSKDSCAAETINKGISNNVLIEKDTSNRLREAKSVLDKKVNGEKIEAPMPGIILSVNINEGDKIAKGQIMFILEAMKMENEIMAPRDGKVLSVDIAKGGKVDTGDLLAVIE